MRLNIPNILTLIRVALIPVFFVVFYLPYAWAKPVAAIIFIIAGITDWLDGYLARVLQQSTAFGAFLDPVADKVMVAVALVLLADHYHSILITVPAATMIAREVIISALREWMAEIGKRASVAVSWIGKFKTATQMFALTILLWRPESSILYAGYVALYIATILTYWSMVQYLLAAKSDLTADTDLTK